MKILLKSIELENFKGIKSLKVNFGEIETIIKGRNESGKTRIADAYNWILFGKDTKDRKDFELKCLDEENNVIHGLDASVEAVIIVDGKEIKIKRIYKEKWTKKTGEAERLLTGHETDFFIDDVEYQKKHFDSKIETWFSEVTFKLLSTNNYFNIFVDWKKRREIIMDMCADSIPNDKELASKHFKELVAYIENKELQEVIIETKAKKAMVNKEIKEIPVRIDELKKSEKNCEIDVSAINKKIAQIDNQNFALDRELVGISTGNSVVEKINSLKIKANDLTRQIKVDKQAVIDSLEADLKKKSNVYSNICSSIDEVQEILQKLENKKEDLQENRNELVKNWDAIKLEKFDNDNTACPTCFQKLTKEKIQILLEEFEASKKTRLDKIKEKGKKTNSDIAENEKAIEAYTKEFEESKEELGKQSVIVEAARKELESEEKKETPKTNDEIQKIIEEVKLLESSLTDKNGEQKTEILKQKTANTLELKRLNELLVANANISNNEKRIEALRTRERELEKLEFLTSEFIKKKVELVEEKVAEKFTGIKFKLFKILVNGALDECCETTVEGVPFQALSNGAQIKCGLTVIDALQKHYKMSLPIFVDNAEGITKEYKLDTQIVKLFAQECDFKTLS